MSFLIVVVLMLVLLVVVEELPYLFNIIIYAEVKQNFDDFLKKIELFSNGVLYALYAVVPYQFNLKLTNGGFFHAVKIGLLLCLTNSPQFIQCDFPFLELLKSLLDCVL